MPRTNRTTPRETPPRSRPATCGRLIAATRDAALGRALQALAEDISIVIVDDVRKLTDEMLRHGSNLALVDAAVVDQPLEGVVDALAAQFPDLRLMVAGQASEQSLLASRLANETVFRFVNKPASPQRLKLFLEAAALPTGCSHLMRPHLSLPWRRSRPPMSRRSRSVWSPGLRDFVCGREGSYRSERDADLRSGPSR